MSGKASSVVTAILVVLELVASLSEKAGAWGLLSSPPSGEAGLGIISAKAVVADHETHRTFKNPTRPAHNDIV